VTSRVVTRNEIWLRTETHARRHTTQNGASHEICRSAVGHEILQSAVRPYTCVTARARVVLSLIIVSTR
jgi:hypothetical protein